MARRKPNHYQLGIVSTKLLSRIRNTADEVTAVQLNSEPIAMRRFADAQFNGALADLRKHLLHLEHQRRQKQLLRRQLYAYWAAESKAQAGEKDLENRIKSLYG